MKSMTSPSIGGSAGSGHSLFAFWKRWMARFSATGRNGLRISGTCTCKSGSSIPSAPRRAFANIALAGERGSPVTENVGSSRLSGPSVMLAQVTSRVSSVDSRHPSGSLLSLPNDSSCNAFSSTANSVATSTEMSDSLVVITRCDVFTSVASTHDHHTPGGGFVTLVVTVILSETPTSPSLTACSMVRSAPGTARNTSTFSS